MLITISLRHSIKIQKKSPKKVIQLLKKFIQFRGEEAIIIRRVCCNLQFLYFRTAWINFCFFIFALISFMVLFVRL